MATTASPHEVELFRSRVRLYLQVMLSIDVCAHLSDLVSPLYLDDLTIPQLPFFAAILRHAVTAALAVGWSYTKFAKPGRSTLIAMESGVTIGLALVYVHIALAHMTETQAKRRHRTRRYSHCSASYSCSRFGRHWCRARSAALCSSAS